MRKTAGCVLLAAVSVACGGGEAFDESGVRAYGEGLAELHGLDGSEVDGFVDMTRQACESDPSDDGMTDLAARLLGDAEITDEAVTALRIGCPDLGDQLADRVSELRD